MPAISNAGRLHDIPASIQVSSAFKLTLKKVDISALFDSSSHFEAISEGKFTEARPLERGGNHGLDGKTYH